MCIANLGLLPPNAHIVVVAKNISVRCTCVALVFIVSYKDFGALHQFNKM
jgi:hypothetical protein